MASRRADRVDHDRAAELLEQHWSAVTAAAEQNPKVSFIRDRRLSGAIVQSVNHRLVSYRFCLPIQLLGKLTNPQLDARYLQRGKSQSDLKAWDARSLGSKVVAPFNQRQEAVLGSSSDPYVGNAMRIPQMKRNDKTKRDVVGWNTLLDVLDTVEEQDRPAFTESIFRQVLLEVFKRQQTLRFTYPVPPRVSLPMTISIAEQFLVERSGGDRALAIAGALFDVIGSNFQLFAQVNRARINATDEATGQVADLECVNERGEVVLAVEVKDRALTLAAVEGTITKTRNRQIHEVFFTAPKLQSDDAAEITNRFASAFAAGQNFYVFDVFDLARAVLALGGEAIRPLFLKKVGHHLDTWNTQPSHRQSWKRLLESL